MIDKTIEFCERVTKEAGVEVKLAEPAKELMRVSVVTNSVVGVGLFTAGILLSSKVLATIGVIGLAGAVVMAASNSADKKRCKLGGFIEVKKGY